MYPHKLYIGCILLNVISNLEKKSGPGTGRSLLYAGYIVSSNELQYANFKFCNPVDFLNIGSNRLNFPAGSFIFSEFNIKYIT